MTRSKNSYEHTTTNKRRLRLPGSLGALLVALITMTAPANAVDYLQCREMLRTKNEMLEKARELEGSKRIEYLKVACPEWSISNPLERYNAIKGKENCKAEYLEAVILPTKKPVYKSSLILPGDEMPRLYYYNTASINWVKSAENVVNDMRRGNCPYR